MITRIF